MITMIVAMGTNRVIGMDNRMPWHLPADLKYFRQATWGHPVVMGRKTFQSIGKALPGRENIVLTRDRNLQLDGATIVHDMQDIIKRAANEQLFIIGGSEIYAQFLAQAERLLITQVAVETEGDAYFPVFDKEHWRLIKRTEGSADSQNPFHFAFEEWTRVREEIYGE